MDVSLDLTVLCSRSTPQAGFSMTTIVATTSSVFEITLGTSPGKRNSTWMNYDLDLLLGVIFLAFDVISLFLMGLILYWLLEPR